MRIIVVSDTHMPRMSKKLPERLIRELRQADMILHAGDWTRLAVYEMLAAYAPTDGVAGNNDGPEIADRFGLRKLLDIGGSRIGIVHGHGAAARIGTENYAVAAFSRQDSPDIVIYGHSHIPVLGRRGGMLVFNPGSPTDKRRQSRYSFGVLTVSGGRVEAEHIFFDSKE